MQTDRKTPLGELNWIFTAITDTIAWNVLPKPLFQKLFRSVRGACLVLCMCAAPWIARVIDACTACTTSDGHGCIGTCMLLL